MKTYLLRQTTTCYTGTTTLVIWRLIILISLILLLNGSKLFAQSDLEIRHDGIVLPVLDTASIMTPDKGQLIMGLHSNQLTYFNGSIWHSASDWNKSGNDLYLLSGKVGLGTTSPATHRLLIAGNTEAASSIALDNQGNPSNKSHIEFRSEGTPVAQILSNTGNSSNGSLRFRTANGGTLSTHMAISTDGDVGIGTQFPNTKLHVINDVGNTYLRLEADPDNTDDNAQPRLELYQDGGNTSSFMGYSNGDNNLRIIQKEANEIRIGTDNGVDLTIDGNGQVGIGTTTPSSDLEVIGTSTFGDVYADYIEVSDHKVLGSDTGGGFVGHVARVANTHLNNETTKVSGLAIGLEGNGLYFDDNDRFITFFDGFRNALGTIESTFNGVNFKAGVNFKSIGADFAELLEKQTPEEPLKNGDIVGVKNGKISSYTEDADQLMVISSQPIVTGNAPDPEREHLFEPVAFIGQVPIRIKGSVKAGDYIIPDGEGSGLGISLSQEEMTLDHIRMIVGQAWESSNDEQIKLINCVVGLNQSDILTEVLMAKIAQLEKQIQSLEVKKSENID